MPAGRRVIQAWWALYLILKPLYLASSGTPQLSELYFAATFPLVFLLRIGRIARHRELMLWGGTFVAYAACVNLYWFTQYYDPFALMSMLYFAYNLFLALAIVAVFQLDPSGMARLTRRVLLATLLFEAGFVLVVGDLGYGRALGTFNDPNQMGYWALLTATCIFALREHKSLRGLDLLALGAGGFVVFTSVSRAAMLGFVVLIVLVVAFSRIGPRTLLGACATALALVAVDQWIPIGIAEQYGHVLDFVSERFNSTETPNDSLAARGYGRLWLFPEHLLFGAGEGGYELRFDLENETHSTLGAIAFGYGVIGLSLFGLLLLAFLRRASWFRILLVMPIMVYGIAQQGVRFSLFWMFLAFVYALSTTEERPNDRARLASSS